MKAVGVVTLPFARHVVEVVVTGMNMQIQRVGTLFNAGGCVEIGVGDDIIPRC